MCTRHIYLQIPTKPPFAFRNRKASQAGCNFLHNSRFSVKLEFKDKEYATHIHTMFPAMKSDGAMLSVVEQTQLEATVHSKSRHYQSGFTFSLIYGS